MQYFTPERFLRLQRFDDPAGVERAAAEWNAAVEDYNATLERIRDRLTPGVRVFLDDYCLHDATVVGSSSMAEAATYRLLVREEGVDGLTELVYRDAEPSLDESAFPEADRAEPVTWLYDEIAANPRVLAGWDPLIVHSVLLSDGRVLTVRFRDLTVSRIKPFAAVSVGTVA